MTERAEQRICIKLCVKLEHSSTETIRMVQNTAAMGSWWLAASSQHVPAHASCLLQFSGETSDHPGDLALLQPRFGAPRLLAFPKTKITFEREEISNCQWETNKYDGAADNDWENCVRSQGVYSEGDWGVIVPCTMFLISWINVSIFHIMWLDTFWRDLFVYPVDTKLNFS